MSRNDPGDKVYFDDLNTPSYEQANKIIELLKEILAVLKPPTEKGQP